MYLIKLLLLISLVAAAYDVIAKEDHATRSTLDSLIHLSLEDLMNIEIITTSKNTEDLRHAPGVVSVITRQDIDAFGARSLQDVLNLIPGFTVGRSNLTAHHTTLQVRGSSAYWGESVLFLLNGQRLNEGYTGGAITFLPDYPLDNIKQIEVIRGPGSALYGANAFMGVINMITQTGADSQGGSVSVRGGTNQSVLVKGEYGIKLNEDLNVKIFASLKRHNDEDLPQHDFTWSAGGQTRLLNNRVTADGQYLLNLGSHIQYKGLDFDMFYNTSRNQNNWGIGLPAERIDPQYLQHSHNEQLYLGLRHQLYMTDNLILKSQVSYLNITSQTEIRANGIFMSATGLDAPHPLATANMFIMPINTDTLNAELHLDWQIAPAHNVVAGISFERDTIEEEQDKTNVDLRTLEVLERYIDSPMMGIYAAQREVYALFAQYAWAINDELKLTAGVRTDKYSDFGTTTNPRLALVYKPTAKLDIKALYGQAFHAPAFKDMYRYMANISLPAPDLQPETLETYELQFQYQFTHDILASVSFFTFEIDDVMQNVSTQNPQSPVEMQMQNVGQSSSQGLELELFYRPSQRFSLFANYTYTDPKRNLDGHETVFEGVPKQAINMGLQSQLTPSVQFNLSAYHRWQWTTQKGTPIYADFTPPDFTNINSRLVWQAQPNLNLTFDVFNLLDSIPAYPGQTSIVPAGITANGRTYLVGIEMKFD